MKEGAGLSIVLIYFGRGTESSSSDPWVYYAKM